MDVLERAEARLDHEFVMGSVEREIAQLDFTER